ncbi:MAG: hypothetical protein Q4D98_12875 [Planctomycetia bacterium]|nr:hypothetical protein [Planctomycetia bacterium]
MPDILSTYVALVPISVYFLLIGMMNMSRRPFVVSGTRDLSVLFLAISGMMIVGPVELFFPVGASWQFGIYVWVYVLVLYALMVLLVLLGQRSRINIYNITMADFRAKLSDLAMELDAQARWAGDALSLPGLGVSCYLEANELLANVSLVACGSRQRPEGWRVLQNALTRTLHEGKTIESQRHIGILFFIVGLVLFAVLHGMIWYYPMDFMRAIPDFLRV